MGGFGSGRRGGRPKTEQLKRLDLVSLRRKGYLNGFPMSISWSYGDEPMGSIGLQALADGLRLFYSARTIDGEWHAVDEVVSFVWAPMRFGGRRQWFRCPKCARTCRILYGGSRFRCRRCCGLSYNSQAETRADRATRAMFKIVRRLDPKEDCNDLPWKPKGMHWRTYNRLAYEATGASASATNDYKIALAISADAPLARAAQLRARERMRSLTSGKLALVRSQDFITDFRKPPIKRLPRDDTIGSDGTVGAPPPGGLPESPEVIAPEPVKEPHEVVKVFYATDRKRTESTAPNETFGSERGELTLGVCEVSIPKSHVEGQMEGPNPFALEFREDPERHVVLLKVTDLSKDSFMNELKARVGASSGRKAFLFVHGFNVSFKDAARRTAQLHKDLAFDGAPVFYSRPSQASVLSYTVDSTNAEWSVATLKGFLKDFVAGSDAQQVFLIAHSMGTQLLTAALAQVLAEDPSMGTKLTAIVLAAPDIDADVFRRDLAPRFAATGTNVVLYASNSDQALSLSRQVHGYRRAGDSSDGALIVEGIDTIEASGIDTSLLGHSYYGSIKTVLSDIGGVLTTGSRAEKRTGLKPVSGYWQFVGPPQQ